MEINLKNKIALVTGASKGIGKEIALTLARAGAGIVACARKSKDLDEVVDEIKKLGVTAYKAEADATKVEEVKEVFKKIVSPIGKLDILVNNVGGAKKFKDFEKLSDEEWKDAYQFNFMSTVYFTRESLKWLRDSKSARIINISTVAARQAGFFIPHYSAAKAAMLNLNKHLANILAKDKILVNAICPSSVMGTDAWWKNVKNKADFKGIAKEEAKEMLINEEKEKNPIGRIALPEDIASLVLFLASDKAKFITGSCFNVDGGTTRSIF